MYHFRMLTDTYKIIDIQFYKQTHNVTQHKSMKSVHWQSFSGWWQEILGENSKQLPDQDIDNITYTSVPTYVCMYKHNPNFLYNTCIFMHADKINIIDIKR